MKKYHLYGCCVCDDVHIDRSIRFYLDTHSNDTDISIAYYYVGGGDPYNIVRLNYQV